MVWSRFSYFSNMVQPIAKLWQGWFFIFGTPGPFPQGSEIQDFQLLFPLPKLSAPHPKPGGIRLLNKAVLNYVLPGVPDFWVSWGHMYLGTCWTLMHGSGGNNHWDSWFSYLQGTITLWWTLQTRRKGKGSDPLLPLPHMGGEPWTSSEEIAYVWIQDGMPTQRCFAQIPP